MNDLHILPRFADRWSHVYLEHGIIEREDKSLVVIDQSGRMPLPIDQLGVLLLGPGTSITQPAIHLLAENNCLVCWTGEGMVRLYAHSTGGTHSACRLLRQARLFCDEKERLAVAYRMYQKRFPEPIAVGTPLDQIRGREGARMRAAYQKLAEEYKVDWQGRCYDCDDWNGADPLNRALSVANSCLYGICHAAILSVGYSPAIGFIHSGKMLSFVYDIADLYKTELTIPIAFQTIADGTADVERRVRLKCRDRFFSDRLMDRILPDIAEVLDAGNDIEGSPDEFERDTVSLVDRT